MIKKLFAALFGATAISVQAETASIDFEVDSNVQKMAEAYSLDCVDFVKNNFGVSLDWSDESVQTVEELLAKLSGAVNSPNPPPQERISDFSKIFGFYVGEVYRKNHGNVSWGGSTIEGDKYFALGDTSSNLVFWPVMKTNKRIVLGQEENMWMYYQALPKK